MADILSGIGATVGNVSYSGSAGLVSLSKVKSSIPFILFCLILIFMSFFPPIGAFLSTIPLPVGYSVVTVAFCQMLGFGLKDYASLKLTEREFLVIGLPIIIGTGIISIPSSAFATIPLFIRYIVNNPLIIGMILCILLEHVFLQKKD